MGKKQSLRSKAVHLVSDLTTVLLNPISDNNKPSKPSLPPSEEEEVGESKGDESESEGSHDLVEGPDTSSFSAFLYSFLSSSDSGEKDDVVAATGDEIDDPMKDNFVAKKGLLSRGKQTLGRAIYKTARMGGFRRDNLENDGHGGVEMKHIQPVKEPLVSLVNHIDQKKKEPVVSLVNHLPQISEPSMLISDAVRNTVYASLPALIHGRKWLLLYSTWKNGISLSTLYRRSMLWPGLSLLVVGDRKGAVFGGLVEAPLRPSNKRKYQGTNNSFVFTNISGGPVVYRPTGVNRYFTLCTTDFLAIGGGGHFALYLEGDLLNGSSSVSETYGNPCLAHSQEFKVKEVELWGFVFPSKYEEILELSRTEAPGICRW